METDKEAAQLARLKKIVPWLAITLSVATFVIILMAGHSSEKAFIVAGLMLGFVLITFWMRVRFGPSGFIVALFILAFIGWRLQQAGLV